MSDRVAVIAGVGPGNGASLVRRFARDGYRVAMLARNAERLRELESEVAGSRGFAVDVTDRDAVFDTCRALEEELGTADVLVHNAAIGAFGEFLDTAPEVFEEAMSVNMMSLVHLGQALGKGMVGRGAGAIIVMGNTSSLRGKAAFAPFAPSKAAQRILAESMARSLGPKGVHVAYVVIDAVIDMPWARQMFPESPDEFFIQPDSIADNVYALVQQDRCAWTHRLDLRPFGENW